MAVLAVAVNLRAGIAAVSPVLPDIRLDLTMSGAAAGLLTTLPVLCFALVAPIAAWFGARAGLDRALLVACLLIAVASVVRVLGGTAALLVGTVIVGAAMTVGNILVPAVIKRDFAHRAATVMGLFTAALIGGAAASAALTAPVADAAGWRVGVGVWAVPAVAGAVLWWLAIRRTQAGPGESGLDREPSSVSGTARDLVRSPVAWAVAIVLGAQGAAYFSFTAWLPTILVDEAGVTVETGGFAMSAFQVLGLLGAGLVSLTLNAFPRQRWLAMLVAGGFATMALGLLIWPAGWPAWTFAGGVAQGAGLALALSLVVVRAADASVARGMSAMAQFIGYGLAAGGPLVLGGLYEVTGSWTWPLISVLGMSAVLAVSGAVAGRDVAVSPRSGPIRPT